MNNTLTKKRYPSIRSTFFPFSLLYELFKYHLLNKLSKKKSNDIYLEPDIILEDLYYGEVPRIHNNHLYFSDFPDKKIYKINIETNKIIEIIDFPYEMAGIGWLPDGRMVAVAMKEMLLVLYDEVKKELNDYADISKYSFYKCNDMVIDTIGRAYIGNFGFPLHHLSKICSTTLVLANKTKDNDINVSVVANDLFFPNGAGITPDNKTLIIGETLAGQLTAFDIDKETGHLSNRRIWASIGVPVDGLCLDSENCVWVAIPQFGMYSFFGGALFRVKEGGMILDKIYNKKCVFACMLATVEKTHYLYYLEANTSDERKTKLCKSSKLKRIKVKVGPARINGNSRYNAGYC